ncbi:hypothetical protein Tco_0158996 [Tanacetum coccineum]
MMSQETLPISLWGYALETATHILNLVPTKKVSKTPLRCGRENVLLLGTSKYGVVRFSLDEKLRFLVYGGEEELGMTGYCDANWQTHKDDSRSQSGWLFLLNRGAVTWKSLKQDTVADFTCNSEYIAACEASKEAIWMKNFFVDLGFVLTVQDPIEIFYDNESAVALTNPRIRESQSILK